MKRFLIVAAVALALPVAAQAKEITGLSVCGPSDCEGTGTSGWGHDGPLVPGGEGQAGPPFASYYRIRIDIDGQQDVWPMFYEPETGLVGHGDDAGQTVWTRFRPEIAAAVKDAAARVDPFPPPRITEVRIGDRVLRDGAATYLKLLKADGAFAVPGSGPGWPIRFSVSAENPWTQGSLLYYPDDGILARGAQLVKLPPALAADIEAARPLGAGSGTTVIPWIALGVLFAGLTLMLGLRLRKWPGRVPEPEATPAH